MSKGLFICGDCSFSSRRWFGRCPECGSWSSASESLPQSGGAEAAPVSTLDALGEATARLGTGIQDFDRVLGGGLVPGAVVLLAGEPGIGKSTLVLQLLDGVMKTGHSALLVSGEESIGQVARRARRLRVEAEKLRAAATTAIGTVLATAAQETPEVLVIDSIQTLDDGASSTTASVTKVRECASALIRYAKTSGTAVVLVGHVTKEGTVAGPKALEHLVDAVVMLEGERSGTLRLLRAVKNRFGSCEETGVFLMGEHGLEAVEDASAMLLADRRRGIPGSVVFPGLQGSRPVLVEIQALATPGSIPHPRRVPLGIDARRLGLLLGVLTERAKLHVGDRDVFVAAAGGLVVKEPAVDLAVCLSLFSAVKNVALNERLVALGEVGLGGEVRRVPGCERRLAEAARLGFERALVPRGMRRPPRALEIVEVTDINQAFVAAEPIRRGAVA